MNTLRDALEAVERELAEAEPRLTALNKRVIALRQTQAGLRNVLDLDSAEASATTAPIVGMEEEPRTDERERQRHDQEVVLGRPASSVQGVRLLLKENADTPVRLEDIRAEFKQRGWVDPDWARPDSAIYAAVVRLGENDPHVVREGKRRWKYVTTPTAAAADSAVGVYTP